MVDVSCETSSYLAIDPFQSSATFSDTKLEFKFAPTRLNSRNFNSNSSLIIVKHIQQIITLTSTLDHPVQAQLVWQALREVLFRKMSQILFFLCILSFIDLFFNCEPSIYQLLIVDLERSHLARSGWCETNEQPGLLVAHNTNNQSEQRWWWSNVGGANLFRPPMMNHSFTSLPCKKKGEEVGEYWSWMERERTKVRAYDDNRLKTCPRKLHFSALMESPQAPNELGISKTPNLDLVLIYSPFSPKRWLYMDALWHFFRFLSCTEHRNIYIWVGERRLDRWIDRWMNR